MLYRTELSLLYFSWVKLGQDWLAVKNELERMVDPLHRPQPIGKLNRVQGLDCNCGKHRTRKTVTSFRVEAHA
jgi:hypothetical protein